MIQVKPARRLPALLASGVMLAAGALACGAGASTTAGAPSASGRGAPDASIMAIVHCYRAHGDPSFPDPVYDPNDGEWHFAASPGSAPVGARQACQHLFPSGNASPPVPQPQFQALVRLAECLRRSGMPNWPDPDPDGSYPLPPSLLTKTPGYERAAHACQRFWPAGGIDVHAAS